MGYIDYRFKIVNTASATARTFMPILSYSSTTNSNFNSIVVNFYYYNVGWNLIMSTTGMNNIVQLDPKVTFTHVIVRLMSTT